jgi:5-methylcytosine-specific restriction endonuclease McrA
MPMRRELYPTDWEAISLRIRERDGWMCKRCGAENRKPHPVTGSIVVLTVAHLHDPDPMNCADDNLAALCQRCHLAHDRPRNLAARRARRQGQSQAAE